MGKINLNGTKTVARVDLISEITRFVLQTTCADNTFANDHLVKKQRELQNCKTTIIYVQTSARCPETTAVTEPATGETCTNRSNHTKLNCSCWFQMNCCSMNWSMNWSTRFVMGQSYHIFQSANRRYTLRRQRRRSNAAGFERQLQAEEPPQVSGWGSMKPYLWFIWTIIHYEYIICINMYWHIYIYISFHSTLSVPALAPACQTATKAGFSIAISAQPYFMGASNI